MLLNQFTTTLDSLSREWGSLLSEKKIQRPALDFIDRLKTLDLKPIAYKLMHPNSGNGWNPTQTQQAIAQYLIFLYFIYHYPHSQLVPTPEIDQVWHQHILDTQKYAKDCQKLFGRFIHHFPDNQPE